VHETDWPSTTNDEPSVSNFFPFTKILPNPVMVPEAEADPLPLAPPALAEADGDPSLQALKKPANPIAPIRVKKQDGSRIVLLLVMKMMRRVNGVFAVQSS
jgi:hypothetical protein